MKTKKLMQTTWKVLIAFVALSTILSLVAMAF
jgi:hypothetical protein